MATAPSNEAFDASLRDLDLSLERSYANRVYRWMLVEKASDLAPDKRLFLEQPPRLAHGLSTRYESRELLFDGPQLGAEGLLSGI